MGATDRARYGGYSKKRYGPSQAAFRPVAGESCPTCKRVVQLWSTFEPPTWWCRDCQREWRDDEVLRVSTRSPR